MAAIIRYERGYDTRIPAAQTPRLDRMLRALGDPASVRRSGPFLVLEWEPIYPGVPVPAYQLREPWPAEKGRIPIVSVTFEVRP